MLRRLSWIGSTQPEELPLKANEPVLVKVTGQKVDHSSHIVRTSQNFAAFVLLLLHLSFLQGNGGGKEE